MIRLLTWNGEIFGHHICPEHLMILILMMKAQINMIRQGFLDVFSLHCVLNLWIRSSAYKHVIILQGFEKMISGMYLGDIVRRVLLRMSQQSDIFGESAHHLSTPFILRSVPMLFFLCFGFHLMCLGHEL